MHPNQKQPPEKYWKQVYLSVLFENNKATMPLRIAEAQRAMLKRRKELFNSPRMDGDWAQERQALDTALFSLEALKRCFNSSQP